RRWWFR
nr:Chain A, cRW2 peptide [synthetic construct]